MSRIKFDFTFHPQWWHKHAGVNFSKDFFNDYKFRIDQDIKMRKTLYSYFGEFGYGSENPMPRPIIDTNYVAGEYLQALLLGCETRYFDDAYPETISRNISDKDLDEFESIPLEDNEGWTVIENQMKALKKEFGYVESYLDLHGVQNLALSLRGQQIFIDYYENPEAASKVLTICTKLIIDVAKKIEEYSFVLGGGVTAIINQMCPEMFITSNCTVDMVSSEIYEKFLLECDNKISDEFKTFGVHHCGRNTERFAESYSKINNISFLEVGAFSDIQKVREEFKNIHLNLRYSPIKLKESSKAEIKSDIQKMIKEGKPVDKLSISCVGIDGDTPVKNVTDFIEVMQKIEV